MIERKIVIGLITSLEYIKKIKPYWENEFIESSTAKILCKWCFEHFEKYDNIIYDNIDQVFFQNIDNLDPEDSEEIETTILPELSKQYLNEKFDSNYLLTETLLYFKTRQYSIYTEKINDILKNGIGDPETKLSQIDQIKNEFIPISLEIDNSLDLSKPEILDNIEKAFTYSATPKIEWPNQLGVFWNSQFVAGAYILLQGQEKVGKTWMLLGIAKMAAQQNKNVAFFQAGDMDEDDQLQRIAINLTHRSNEKEYCEEHYRCVKDCFKNQLNICSHSLRTSEYGPFDDGAIVDREGLVNLTEDELKEAYELFTEYRPCSNCLEYQKNQWGVPWLKKIKAVTPINYEDAQKAVDAFYIKYNRKFKLSTHPTDTLTFEKIESILNLWQSSDDFIPEIIIIDYLELLAVNRNMEERHKQNEISKNLRKLSTKPLGGIKPIVITATQVSATAYEHDTLTKRDFSEDKRKFAHPTMVYGLNRDVKGKEEALGLLRINELFKRKGQIQKRQVTLIQDLRQGQPFLGSYF